MQRPLGYTGPWECGQIKRTHEELVEAGLEGRGGPREGVLALGYMNGQEGPLSCPQPVQSSSGLLE